MSAEWGASLAHARPGLATTAKKKKKVLLLLAVAFGDQIIIFGFLFIYFLKIFDQCPVEPRWASDSYGDWL